MIGTASGATPELINPGDNGLLFKPGDVNELAEKIERLCERPELLEKMGRNAAISARKRFTTEQYATAIENVYKDVVNNNMYRVV